MGTTYGYTLAAAQAALKDAVSTGCRSIVFTAGTYVFNASFKVATGSVRVSGLSGATIQPLAGATLSDGLIKVNANDVTLTGLTLDGLGRSIDGIVSSSLRTIIKDTSVTGVRRGISLRSSAADASVSRCTVTNFTGQGVLTQAARTTVDACKVATGGGTGMWAFSGADSTKFTNNDVSGSRRIGIEFYHASNFITTGNTVHDNHLMGIHMLRSNGGVVENNTVYNNENNGIDAHGSTNVTIVGNSSSFNGGPRLPETLEGQGIIVYCSQYIDVLNNTVWDNAQEQPGKRSGITVSDNFGANGELLTNHVKVDGNTAYDDQPSATQEYAIRIGGPSGKKVGDLDYITVTNNRGWGNIKAGLFTVGLANPSSPHNEIHDNDLLGRSGSTTTAPSAPTNVTATAGNTAATVRWTAGSNRGSAITGYTVTSSLGGFTASVGGSATSATVSGLSNGTSYTFRVTATNSVGTSVASAPSNAVTPQAAATATAPEAPTNVTATAGNTAATVSWTPAFDGGSAITGYTVTSSLGGFTASAGGSATSVTVSGLSNGTSYTFTVTATNSVGTSAASAPSNAVTPSASGTTVQEDAPAVSYNTWDGLIDSAANGGSYRISKTANATTRITFTGTSVEWLMRNGPDRGQAAVTLDGVSKGTVDLYAATLTSASEVYAGLASKTHTLVIKVLGTKSVAATAANVTVDGFLVGAATTAVDDTSPQVVYNSWKGATSASADGAAYRISATAGAMATLTFTGTGVEWITAIGPGYGQVSVRVDGGAAVTLDLYSPAQQWGVTGRAFTGLTPGPHTVVIKVLGTKNAAASGTDVVMDAFVVR
ncbi:MAG: fibronectin type III domain-containing protein [Mycobacteriales bacterium]